MRVHLKKLLHELITLKIVDLSPDGKRFILIDEGAETAPAQHSNEHIVVRGWLAELERRTAAATASDR